MSDNVTRLGKGVRSLKTAPKFDGYTKVVIVQSEDYEYAYGTDEGRTLTLENPWATYNMAKNLQKSVLGFQYQPYSASGAILDPAAELGDAISVNNIYGGIYRQKTTFGRDYRADVSAPGDEEINHEFPYKTSADRKVTRKLAQFESELSVQADKIYAKVDNVHDATYFGWELLNDSWSVKANGADILKATKEGLEITGVIHATGGTIGGMALKDGALSTNGQTYGGTNSQGIYLGPNGLQLGTGFRVDPYGNLEATSGKFSGAVSAGSIEYGGTNGYFSGGGISDGSIYGSRLAANTITTSKVSDGIIASLANADYAYDCCSGSEWFIDIKITGSINYQNYKLSRETQTVMTGENEYKNIYYIGWG